MRFNPITFGINLFSILRANQMGNLELHHIESQRFHKLFDHTLKHSIFYQSKYQKILTDEIQFNQLSPVTKKELMEHFDDWVVDSDIKLSDVKKFILDSKNIGKPYLDKYVVWESSGSSGLPGIFLQSTEAMEIYDALEFSRKSVSQKYHQCFDPFYLMSRVAFVGANSGHFASNISFERVKLNNPYLNHSFRSFSILDSRETLIDELNRFNPNILVTYPSAAVALADAKKNGHLTVNLSEILMGGENLTLTMKKYLHKIFSCKLINNYGASEFLPIAWECDEGQLHLNSDWVILEPVDQSYQPVPVGTMSYTTLLTNLANYVQPLIRYDLGDSISINKHVCSCGCKLPTIELQGRGDDILRMKTAEGVLIDILPLGITTILEENLGLYDFQVKLVNSGEITIALPLTKSEAGDLMKRSQELLRNYLEAQGVNSIKFIEKYGVQPNLGRSGKVKRVLSFSKNSMIENSF